MSSTAFKRDKNWKRLQTTLEPGKVDKIMRRHLRRASALNGKIAEGKIRDTIRSGGFTPNAPLTAAIKGSSKPLIGGGAGAQLFNAVTSKVMEGASVFVGILKINAAYNVGVAIHQGAIISVTSKMRGLFFILWQASVGAIDPSSLTGRAKELWDEMPGGWKPLKKNTRAIITPARPFIRKAFADPTLRDKAKKNWQQAMAAAFKEIASAAK